MTALSQIARSPALRLSAFAMMLLGVQNASIAPYVSVIAIERVGLTAAQFSAVLTLGAMVAVVSAVLFGVLGDQRGRRRKIALLTALAAALGIGLMTLAPSPLALVLCHAILLPLGSSLYGQVFALARLASPKGSMAAQDAILGTVRAGMSITFMAMLGIWTLAFGAGVDVMWTYSAALVAALVLVGLAALIWPEAGQSTQWQDRPSGQSFAAALGELARPRVALRLGILGVINASFVIYFILISLIFDASPLRDASDVALYVGLVAGIEVPLLMMLPRLLAHTSRANLIAIGAAFYALHIVMMPIWVDTPWLWVGALIAGVGGTAFIGLTIGYYQDLLTDRPGAAGAMLAVQKLVADLLGAAGFAIGMAIGTYHTVALIGFVLPLGGAMLLWWVDRRA